MSHKVLNSHGDLAIDAEGRVLEFKRDENGGLDLSFIDRFDTVEWLLFWLRDGLPDEIDVLDLGYWDKDGVYEPPDMKWRRKLKAGQIDPPEDRFTECDLCGRRMRFEDTWSPDPGDMAICPACDTEVSGRKHDDEWKGRVR
jgi:hypothetical protein